MIALTWTKTDSGYAATANGVAYAANRTPGRRFKLLVDGVEWGREGTLPVAKQQAEDHANRPADPPVPPATDAFVAAADVESETPITVGGGTPDVTRGGFGSTGTAMASGETSLFLSRGQYDAVVDKFGAEFAGMALRGAWVLAGVAYTGSAGAIGRLAAMLAAANGPATADPPAAPPVPPVAPPTPGGDGPADPDPRPDDGVPNFRLAPARTLPPAPELFDRLMMYRDLRPVKFRPAPRRRVPIRNDREFASV